MSNTATISNFSFVFFCLTDCLFCPKRQRGAGI